MPSLPRYLLDALRHSFPLIVAVTFLFEGMELVIGDELSASAMIVPSVIIYILLFQVILTRPARIWSLRMEAKDGRPLNATSVMSRSIGIGLLFSALLVIPPVVVALFWPDLRKLDRNAIETLMFLAILAWAGLLFPLLGTMLPAAAMGRPLSLRNILQAARRTWWRVMLQLGLIVLPLLAALLGVAIYGQHAMPALWHSPVAAFALSLVEGIVLWLPFVLTTAILCRAYEQGYPAEDAAPAPVIIHAPVGPSEG